MTTCLLKSFGKLVSKCIESTTKCSRIASRVKYIHTENRKLQSKCGTPCQDGPAYRTRLALPPDYQNVTDFMCEWYFKHEPTFVYSGLGDTEPPPIWRKMMLSDVSVGLSIIAEDRENCIIGAAVNIKTCSWEGARMRELAQCCTCGTMRKMMEFFAFVADEPDLWRRYCVHTIIEMSSLAVCSEFQGFGVAKRLIQESWILARDCGYRLFRQDCNSKYCAKICQDLGWEKVWSLPFCQYMADGEIVFKNIKGPHNRCEVYVDPLNNYKVFCPPSDDCATLKPTLASKTD